MADAWVYTNLITSEHSDKPKFMKMIAALVQPSVDMQNLCARFPTLFDINLAVGDQLDIIGRWVGVSRQLVTPLTGVFFSWGTPGLGWGQGTWFSPFDQEGGLINLPDDSYRMLLLATVASNQWDGTIPGAYQILQLLFELSGFQILIQDNQDMTISVILLANTVDAVFSALLHSGAIIMRPAGVGIAGFFKATTPVFGWGIDSDVIGGWGKGNWLKTASF